MAVQLISKVNGVNQTGRKNGYPGISITETFTNGFFTVDRKWTVQYWNQAAEKLLGVLAKDIVGKNLWEKFAGVIPLNFYTVYQKAFLKDVPVHFQEYWAEMGAWFDVITCHSNGILSVSFKSSNQAPSTTPPEKQLKILNELYRFVTEVTNDCLWEWNFKTKEIFWIDGSHKRVFGYPIENALIPQSFWESSIHPDDKPGLLKKLNKIIEEKACDWEDEYRFIKTNGDYAYVHDRGHIIYDHENTACRMIGATQDITDRRFAQIQLLESEKKLALIARQTANAIIITDADDKITWVNSAFTRMTEYRGEEVIGREAGSFLQGKETDPLAVEYLRKQIRDKQPFNCEIINYSKSGRKHWLHVEGQPLLDEQGNPRQYFTIQTDITEKVLLENRLVQERLASQKEITAAVLTAQENERAYIGKELHDNVNQMLAIAKLYIQVAQTNEKNRKISLEESRGLITNAIEELRKISKVLVIPDKQVVSLFDNIKKLIGDLVRVHPIEIDFFHEGIVENELDDMLQVNIFRIVQEQLNNILKHSEATQAAINLSGHENELILFVSDNGKGFDVSERRKGVGIRNIISRAELFHGRAEIKSKPGKGFQLTVALPYKAVKDNSWLENV